MQLPLTFNALIEDANQFELYTKLVQQVNKDFLFANIDLDFKEDVLPAKLKLVLHDTIYTLIQEKFADYLNLLYIIDVPEQNIKALDGNDTLKLAEDVAFLILKREWQKVWYRTKYAPSK